MPDGEEKQFSATQQRRDQARKKGQVARSAEFGPAATLFAAVVVLHAILPSTMAETLIGEVHRSLQFTSDDSAFGPSTAFKLESEVARWVVASILPVLGAVLLAGLISAVAQVGFQVTPEALAPQWNRVDPSQGIKRLFSLKITVELGKTILKIFLIGMISYVTLKGAIVDGGLLQTMRMPISSTINYVGNILWTVGLRVCATLLIIALADFAYQKYEYEKNMKMTLSELKQEMRQSEGDPHIKGKIRKLQREIAKRRMMQDVPTADVVVTNPTHFAVALQYVPGSNAPRVVAKGQDYVALQIREVAKDHHVPLVEDRILARALYRDVEIGDEIPGDLYEAVAKILAFVYKTYRRRKAVTQ